VPAFDPRQRGVAFDIADRWPARRDALRDARGRGWKGLSDPQQGQLQVAVAAVDPELGKQVAGVYAAARALPWERGF
jgi:hypothetical protein